MERYQSNAVVTDSNVPSGELDVTDIVCTDKVGVLSEGSI